MPAYAIFDVEIRDLGRYQDFMTQVKPALEAAGARYLARGGKHKVTRETGRRVVSCYWNSLPSRRSNLSIMAAFIRA